MIKKFLNWWNNFIIWLNDSIIWNNNFVDWRNNIRSRICHFIRKTLTIFEYNDIKITVRDLMSLRHVLCRLLVYVKLLTFNFYSVLIVLHLHVSKTRHNACDVKIDEHFNVLVIQHCFIFLSFIINFKELVNWVLRIKSIKVSLRNLFNIFGTIVRAFHILFQYK